MYGHGDGFVSILPFFNKSELEKFQYEDDFEMNSSEMEVFTKFLIGQEKLKKLSLTRNVTQLLFANDKFCKSVKFACENIFVWMNGPEQRESPTAGDAAYVNLVEFISTQRNSLKTLTIGRSRINRELLQLLLSLPINDLRLVSPSFVDTFELGVTNKTVRKIFISMIEIVDSETESVLCEILRSCKSVEKLRFSCVDVTFEMELVIAYEMKNLARLNLYNCHFMPMTFPKLRHIEILSCQTRDVLRLIRVNRHLMMITVGESLMNSERFQRALDETEIIQVLYT